MAWGEKVEWMTRACHQLVDLFARGVVFGSGLVLCNRVFFLALTATILFYLPALKNSSVDAGFLYMGDVLGYYWPLLAKTHALISSWHFTAIDFSSYNGSSEFFLVPNFFAVHPMIVVYSLFAGAKSTSFRDVGHVLVVVLALHSFLACYFSLKLLTRFYLLEFGTAAFAAIAFAFSLSMLPAASLAEPEFNFCASMVPWTAYGALAFEGRPTVTRLLLACMPVVMTYLGGYLPFGAACLVLAAALVLAKIILLDDATILLVRRIRRLATSMLPFICASMIVAPYLISVYLFVKASPSANAPSLFFSAHQLAEFPQTLLRVISSHLDVPGPFFEFSATWGIMALTIAALFLLSPRTFKELSTWEWKIFKIFAVIYYATALAIFGRFSVVSDLVYYFIPQIGAMHIYQRFLLPANLLLSVMIGLMLKSVAQAVPVVMSRIALIVLALATLSVSYLVSHNPALSAEIGVNNYIIMELFFSFLFVFALIVPGKIFTYSAAIVLFALPALGEMYGYSAGKNTLSEQQKLKVIALDDAARAKLVSYLKRYSDKEIIKYVDITPMWTKAGSETFPKSFPYFVLNELNLSSYGGFAFYLSARADYMQKMPVRGDEVELNPDWDYVKKTGADFVVARELDLKTGALAALIDDDEENIYRLPNDVVIAPIRGASEKDQRADGYNFDNGYFRVLERKPVEVMENIARHKIARQSSTMYGADAGRAIDGNTSGLFSEGSVTHTNPDVNAWWEIDLSAIQPIDSIKIWNRTDCCGFRLKNYWIFISEKPFADADTAADLRNRPHTWGRMYSAAKSVSVVKIGRISGRFVRIQLGGEEPLEQSYLSLAEVEIRRANDSSFDTAPKTNVLGFTTNKANYLRLDVESSEPVTVEYLLWNNPRLTYYLNGQQAAFLERDNLTAFNLSPGRNTIEISYNNRLMTIFWVCYAIFGILWSWAVCMTVTKTLPRAIREQIASENSHDVLM